VVSRAGEMVFLFIVGGLIVLAFWVAAGGHV
jgi:hypothetical protein